MIESDEIAHAVVNTDNLPFYTPSERAWDVLVYGEIYNGTSFLDRSLR